ncbi:hypothetical protein TNCV_4942221 [Trichonephila clavipes]|nr:hypothetical protein TNCV_4942221 [Trichonephila clavipes]
MLKHLCFDIFELQETKLPVRLINTTNERRLVQGHETLLKVKGDIEDVTSELDNGEQVDDIFQEHDSNNDGFLNYKEFLSVGRAYPDISGEKKSGDRKPTAQEL